MAGEDSALAAVIFPGIGDGYYRKSQRFACLQMPGRTAGLLFERLRWDHHRFVLALDFARSQMVAEHVRKACVPGKCVAWVIPKLYYN
jgi:hypothetical protein